MNQNIFHPQQLYIVNKNLICHRKSILLMILIFVMIKINYMKIILKEGLVGPVSRSIRRLASPKRKLKKKILFLVEGKTEKNIIFHLLIKPLSEYIV